MNKYLTVEEERRLVQLGQKGDHDARNQVIMNIYNLINREICKKRHVLSEQYYDCLNYVISVLCRKFHKFNLKRKLRYSTYAIWWVRQARDRFIDHMTLIHIPDFILRPGNQGTDRCHRFRSFAENAKDIRTIEPMAHEPYMRYQEQFVSREESVSHSVDRDDDHKYLDYLLSRLEPREREIVIRRSRGERLRDIGESLGLTRERIRQIEERAIRQMRKQAVEESGEPITSKTTGKSYQYVPACRV